MADVEKGAQSPQSVESLGASSKDNIISASGSSGARRPVNEQTIEPAPAYGLLSKVKSAKREHSDNWVLFMIQFVIILCTSVYSIIFLAITVAIPIAMMAIGSIYLHDCARERYIPIYLIVGGAFGAFSQLVRIIRQIRERNAAEQNADDKQSARPNPLEGILSCFLFAWFIAGNVWVYRTYGDFTTDDPAADTYCHPTVYWFSFWLITATYIMVALGCCGICVLGVCCAIGCKSAMENS